MKVRMKEMTLREAYIDELLSQAASRDDFVTFDADSKEATHLKRFADEYPDKSYSFGIAEQNMVTAAAGFSTRGYNVFVSTYAMFVATRGLDQLLNTVAYPNLNVKFVLSHHGLDVGPDGVTHQVLADLAIMRAVPNMMVVSPADYNEMRSVIRYAMDYRGPMYIRMGKTPVPVIFDDGYVWEPGRPVEVVEGSGVTIFATGIGLRQALRALPVLEEDGIRPRVVNVSSLKPVDEEALSSFARKVKGVVTVEDHSRFGGLGGLVSEILSERSPTPVFRVGAADTFAEAGTPDELFGRYGLGEEDVVRAVRRALGGS